MQSHHSNKDEIPDARSHPSSIPRAVADLKSSHPHFQLGGMVQEMVGDVPESLGVARVVNSCTVDYSLDGLRDGAWFDHQEF